MLIFRPPTVALIAALAWSACGGCSNNGVTPDDAGTEDAGADAAVAPDTATDPDDTGTPQPDADVADLGADMGACTYAPESIEPIPAPDRIHTPRWAFMPWISKDISDTADSYDFVNGFIDRDIPVGVLVLDSPWEDNYNTFIPSSTRYPGFEQLVSDLRDDDIRMVLWVTQFTNSGSFDAEPDGDVYVGPASNFQEGKDCGFYINDGEEYFWWKGKGGSVDFFNPLAAQWWNEQQNYLLDVGVAGWKLDFGDEYVTTDVVQTAAGQKTHQEYSEAYYQDYYEYGIHRVGHDDFVTMVRGYDKSYEFDGRFFARPEHAPVVWAGDNTRDWAGLEDALDHMFRSAAAGYVVVGSDLGGYLDRSDAGLAGPRIPFDRLNFHRWTAMSAMSPFMQLHGRENLTPWTLPNDTDVDESVAVYRFWAKLHTELIPFLYSVTEESYAGTADGLLIPLGEEASWAGDYRYMLGDAFLVAPILDATGIRDVEIPAGTWYDFWTGAPVAGGQTVTADVSADLLRLPVWVKEGAIVPIDSKDDVSGLTDGNLGDTMTVLAWPGAANAQFQLHDESGTIQLEASTSGTSTIFFADKAPRRLVVRLRRSAATTTVNVESAPVAELASRDLLGTTDGYFVDGDFVWVSTAASPNPVTIQVD